MEVSCGQKIKTVTKTKNKTRLAGTVSRKGKVKRPSSSSTESITTVSRVKGGSSSSSSSSRFPVKMTQTPPQQYCLRWNNYQNNLTNVFDQLLQSEAFVDVTLACDGHSLKAHKMVLSACSPFFQTLFFDNPCTHPIVILKDINWDELKAVVEFMYRGEINVSQEQLAPLLKVAEMLKIRGLADVSRGSGGTSGGNQGSNDNGSSGGSSGHRNVPNPADFMSTSNQDSEPGSPVHSNGHLLNHPLLQGHHLSPLNSLLNPTGSSGSSPSAAAHAHALASLNRRKRRKMSTPERTPSPPEDDLDDHSSNQLEVDSQNGDWNNDHSPRSMTADRASSSGDPAGGNGPSGIGLSMSLSSTPTPANTPSLSAAAAAAATVGMSLAGSSSLGSTTASSLVGSLGPAFLNLHAAAAAAVANANSNAGGSGGGGNGGNNPPSTSSSLASDLDLKPGIVEMIREEERAKMLESSHGWLGPSAASSLTDTYQYQIQNLWQKCWNQNQGGVVHALRFRERGPLKSWRPETMAEAIFAVLRDGLSLSQAARKYDIPYPTFVLYANRVHNMLGPSADGCSGTDLMSDMRPKGRGRPQRILLGSWPEEHIRGVIRAVVFRDTPTGKDDFPFIFNRETGLCLSQAAAAAAAAASSASHNGSVDMTLPQQFTNPFLNPNTTTSGTNSLLHHHQPIQSTASGLSSLATSSSGGSSSNSAGAQQTATNLSSSAGNSNAHGVSLININEHAAAAATAAALQHLKQLEQQGTLSASTGSGLPPGSPPSNSTSPLQQVLSSAAAGLLSVQAQRELLALQRHQLQQQRRSSLSTGRDRDRDRDSPLNTLAKKSLSSLSHSKDALLTPSPSPAGLISDAEILQIKTELPSSSSLGGGGVDDELEENDNEDLDGNNLTSSIIGHKLDEQDEGNDHAEVIPLNEGDDEEEQFSTAFKHCVNNPGQQSTCGGGQEEGVDAADMMEEQQADLVKFLNRNSTSSPDNVISGNNGSSSTAGNSPKSSRSANEPNGNANSSNNNNGPKGSASNNSSNNHNAGNSNRKSGSGRGIENNNQLATETLAGEDGQGTSTSSSSSSAMMMTTTSTISSSSCNLADASTSSSRRASLRGTTIGGVGSIIGEVVPGSPSGTPGISTRMRAASSRSGGGGGGGEREVNTPSPLNFHPNQASTS